MLIPKTMKAAILVEQRKPLVIDEVELPQTLDVGQVLVKIHYSGICGSQLGEIDGAKGEDKFLPHLLGHEASATVMEIGPGVKHVKPGDVVVLHWRKGLGIEGIPPNYQWRGQKLNAGWIATFNEYAIVAENRVTAIPQGSHMEVAALIGASNLDHFIDNTGQPPIIEMGYQITKSLGKVTLVGVPRKGNNINIYSLPLHFGKRISGSQGGEAVPHEDIPRYHNMFNAGRIMLSELITEKVPLDHINEAITNIRSGVISGRVLVDFVNTAME